MIEKEHYDIKYMAEIVEYFEAFAQALISEIMVGVSVNLGMSENQAYKIAKNRPDKLQKAGFFQSIFDRFKSIFKWKVPKFRYNQDKLFGTKSKPMTPAQWEKFNNALRKYWTNTMLPVAEDMGLKSYLLGRETTAFREKKKPYKNKSLYQVVTDQFEGDMPSRISQAYKDFDFNDFEKKQQNRIQSSIALYVTDTNDNIKNAIREQIQSGIADNKSSQQVASDLYWEVEKNPQNKNTAESLHKNWNRIASTEMASAFEAGILAPYEGQAMESMKDPKKAVYFVRTGGTCDFCRSVQGIIVRLIPSSVADASTDKLADIGIEDKNTTDGRYIYNGQNNIGRKKDSWFLQTPSHPYNTATMQPINLETEYYNPKSKRVETRQEKKKYIPQQKDYSYISKEERESKRPVFIDKNTVVVNGNTYEAVQSDDYDKKLKASRNDPSLPIPVNIDSPSYKRLFGDVK